MNQNKNEFFKELGKELIIKGHNKNGVIVAVNDKILTSTDQAFLSNRVFTGGFCDANTGDQYSAEWYQPCSDAAGNKYYIVYHFDVTKGDEPMDENLNWDDINNIVDVIVK